MCSDFKFKSDTFPINGLPMGPGICLLLFLNKMKAPINTQRTIKSKTAILKLYTLPTFYLNFWVTMVAHIGAL